MTREQRLFAAARSLSELAPTPADIADYLNGNSRPKPEYITSYIHASEDLREALAAYEGKAA